MGCKPSKVNTELGTLLEKIASNSLVLALDTIDTLIKDTNSTAKKAHLSNVKNDIIKRHIVDKQY
jgi:hypothetical protein